MMLGLLAVITLCSCSDSYWLSEDYIDEDQNQYRIETLMRKDATHSQGMSVVDDKIFVLHENGQCRVYDYKTKDSNAIGAFDLASKSNDMHYNCANFGVEYKDGASFPLLYVTNGTGGVPSSNTCFVESITQTSDSTFTTEVVQVINLHPENFASAGYDVIKTTPQWLVDKERRKLWVFSCNTGTKKEAMGDFSKSRMSATCFELPSLAEGDTIDLCEKDVIKQLLFEADAYVIQGGCIRDGIIYYAYGYGGNSTSPSRIRVYNTDTGNIDLRLNLDSVILNELEDLAYYDNKIIINVSNAYIYSIEGEMLEYMQKCTKSRAIIDERLINLNNGRK